MGGRLVDAVQLPEQSPEAAVQRPEPSVAEKPSLARMTNELAGEDLVVITMASDHNFGDAMAAVTAILYYRFGD